jgi:hypothetical protein
MDKTLHDLVSIDSMTLALHALAKLRKETSDKLEAGEFDGDDFEFQSDRLDRLTLALNEFASVYEPMREGDPNAPSVESIFKRYD